MRMIFRNALLVAIAVALPISAAHASRKSNELLSYIPADSPYVIAMTKPLPGKVADKLEPALDEILQGYQVVMRHIMAETLVKMSMEEGGAEKAEQFRGLMEEFIGLMSLEGIRGAGIERDSLYALYGNGLLPVVRLGLDDPDKFEAAVARMEEKAGKAMEVAELKGESYRYADLDKIRVILALIDDYAVVTFVPSAFGDDELALALGIDKPKDNLRKANTLHSINKEYGYKDSITGYLDTTQIVRTLTGDATGLDQSLVALGGGEQAELSDVCRDEIRGMAEIMPRMVFGYTRLDTESLDASMVMELRDDLAAGLQTLPAAVPGLGVDSGSFMSFGFSMNPLSLREFYEARLDALEADPYKCEKFADMQAGVAKGRELLAQPIPPVVYGFRGFVADIADMDFMSISSGAPPTDIEASLLVAIENAESLVMMAAMMDPQVAALNLLPDGNPVSLDLPQIQAFASEAFAALTQNAVSVSIGTGAEKKASDLLVADSGSPAPVMSMHMDAARYYEMIGEAMMADNAEAEEGKGNEMPATVREALRDLMVNTGAMYDRLGMNVLFTERGVEFNIRTSLAK